MQEMEEQRFDLLDLVSMVVENVKLLIIVPLLAGLIGLGVSYALPKSYTSSAILSLPTTSPAAGLPYISSPTTVMQVANIIPTPLVLNPVISILKLADGTSLQVARGELSGRIKAVVGKDSLLRLDVTASTPTEAQATAVSIVDVWLKSTRPSVRDIERLTKRLNYARTSFESVRRQLLSLSLNDGSGRRSGTIADTGTFMIALSELEARYSLEILTIERAMDGLSRDVLLQEPTLPMEPSAPNKTWIAIGASLFGACMVILWVLFYSAWKRAAKNPAQAKKQERISRALNVGKNR